jgi:hypothetical protein
MIVRSGKGNLDRIVKLWLIYVNTNPLCLTSNFKIGHNLSILMIKYLKIWCSKAFAKFNNLECQ